MNQSTTDQIETAVRAANPVAEPDSLAVSHLGSAVTLLVDEGRRVAPIGRRRIRRRAVAFASGFVLAVVAVGLAAFVLRGDRVDEHPVSDELAPPETPTTQLQPTSEPGGVVTVEIADLVAAEGMDLAGVLIQYDEDASVAYNWNGVAGFVVVPDADPFSTSVALGNVEAEWGDLDGGMWPWASDVATVPPGEYSLQLWLGTDYCCYNRWSPAETPGLRWCEMNVRTSGYDQTIRIAGIGDDHRCRIPNEPDTGTIHLSIDEWEDLEGHQILAGVWTIDPIDLVGGAFWTTVHEGQFISLADTVHPAVDPRLPSPESSDWPDWAADDYVWTETAQLAPGMYGIDFWAHPGRLPPYGSHIPRTTDRQCWAEVEVRAGETSVVSISGIPTSHGPCPLSSTLTER